MTNGAVVLKTRCPNLDVGGSMVMKGGSLASITHLAASRTVGDKRLNDQRCGDHAGSQVSTSSYCPEQTFKVTTPLQSSASNTSPMATLANTVGIIGAGPAGLITAHVLLKDGFDVQVLTEDRSPGGVWARHRVYPSLKINKCVPHATLLACPSFVNGRS